MRVKAIHKVLGLVSFLFLFFTTLHARDLPGSHDHPALKRYEGSEIIKYDYRNYDAYTIPLGEAASSGALTHFLSVEGAVTRITYRVPVGRSVLEVIRNYEAELKASGFDILFQEKSMALGRYFSEAAGYKEIKWPPNIPAFTLNGNTQHYLAAQKPKNGAVERYVVIYAVENNYWAADLKDVKKGQVLVQVDVIDAKLMESKMVTVTAEEMAAKVAQKGGVALYGINFDFNKADIKPESETTLSEIAKLLSKNPALKLLVVGHTDNVGGFEFNRELSQRRANAVFEALVKRHRIDAKRLMPVGVSFACPVVSNRTEDGRVKNRRVELVEQ